MITKSTDARSREKSARLAIENLAVPEYTIFSRKWELCDDVFAGEMKVKAKAEDNGYVYRPESKKGAKRQKAWEAYLGRGTLPDFATKTLGQMVGTLASVPPEITFAGKAARLDYLRDYCTLYWDGPRHISGLWRIRNKPRFPVSKVLFGYFGICFTKGVGHHDSTSCRFAVESPLDHTPFPDPSLFRRLPL